MSISGQAARGVGAGQVPAIDSLQAADPAGRKLGGETAADTRRALDVELGLVAVQRVLDDGQAEPGAAGIA